MTDKKTMIEFSTKESSDLLAIFDGYSSEYEGTEECKKVDDTIHRIRDKLVATGPCASDSGWKKENATDNPESGRKVFLFCKDKYGASRKLLGFYVRQFEIEARKMFGNKSNLEELRLIKEVVDDDPGSDQLLIFQKALITRMPVEPHPDSGNLYVKAGWYQHLEEIDENWPISNVLYWQACPDDPE